MNRPIDHRIFEGAHVEAFRHPLGQSFLGGPVLLDKEFAHFRHKRNDRAFDRFDEHAQFHRYLRGQWAYIGPKYPHFGHILAEMVHRILPTKMLLPNVKKHLIVTTFDDDSGPTVDTLCRAYREVLDFFEIQSETVLILNENAIVQRLALCEQGSNLGGEQLPWYLDALREYSTRRLNQLHGSQVEHHKVYVSKSKMPHGGKILGGQYIEELLAEEGFLVFHPEEAPLSTQMDIYRKASELIFEEGSACHGTELLGDKMLNRTVLFVRRMETRAAFGSILIPRSRDFETFTDTFFLGTIIVNAELGYLHSEFGVSLFDPDRIVKFYRDRQLAQLPNFDVRKYFEAAERDLRDYFNYHMHAEIEVVDLWRVSEVRLEFEKVRHRFLSGHVNVPLVPTGEREAEGDAETILNLAWETQMSGQWLEAARIWAIYRERFPHAEEGFTLGSVALIELGRFYEADAVLTQAIERFPISAEVYSDYALVAHNRRDWREAATRWATYRAKFPQDHVAYALGANALCESERYAEAEDIVRLGLEIHPEDEELLEKHAWIAQHEGNRHKAAWRWRKLKAKHPTNPSAQRFTRKGRE